MAPLPSAGDPKIKMRRIDEWKRAAYDTERRAKLKAEGKCTICGKPNDRAGKWCCSACYERKRVLEKAKAEIVY